MADISVVADKLQGFESADDLAEFFRGYGIIAQPMNARACAITKFVEVETGEKNVITTTTAVIIEDEDGEEIYSLRNTEAMAAFIKAYDTGTYPDLIEAGFEKDIYVGDDNCECCG